MKFCTVVPTAAADRRGVVDGVRVGVGQAECDALALALLTLTTSELECSPRLTSHSERRRLPGEQVAGGRAVGRADDPG